MQSDQPTSEDDAQDAVGRDPPWPVCGGCGRRRQTVCPVCGTASDDFPRADGPLSAEEPSSGDAAGLGLICSTCDEPFVAELLRYCPWCGSDSGSGIDVDPRFDPAAEELDTWNGRAVAVAIGMVAVMALLAGYLMTMANR
jgi:hypothetical protein